MAEEKLRVYLTGMVGRMGQMIISEAKHHPDVYVSGRDKLEASEQTASAVLAIMEMEGQLPSSDVLLIFINEPGEVVDQVKLAAKLEKPVVIGTTGLTDEQKREISYCSARIPIFIASNFSLGVAALNYLVGKAAEILPFDFQAEIVEMHHKGKKDAPSGTAKMLAQTISVSPSRQLCSPYKIVCGRSGISETSRLNNEVGIAVVRGGSIPGDHTVIFAGEQERVELSHFAQSREVFARGAFLAVKWIIDKPPSSTTENGFYGMNDLLGLPPL